MGGTSGIYRIWIIDRKSGLGYIDAELRPLKKDLDADMVGALFSAMNVFAHETFDANINGLEIGHYKILFRIDSHLMLGILLDHNIFSPPYRVLLQRIENIFTEKHPEVREMPRCIDHHVFEPFCVELKTLLGESQVTFRKTGFLLESAPHYPHSSQNVMEEIPDTTVESKKLFLAEYLSFVQRNTDQTAH